MAISPGDQRILDALIKQQVITAQQYESIKPSLDLHGDLLSAMVDNRIMTEDNFLQIKAQLLGVPRAKFPPMLDPRFRMLIPVETAELHTIFPIGYTTGSQGETIVIAMENPNNINTIDELRLKCKKPIQPALASKKEIEQAIRNQYYQMGMVGSVIDNDNTPQFEIENNAGQPMLEIETTSQTTSSHQEEVMELDEITEIESIEPLPWAPEFNRNEVMQEILNALTGKKYNPTKLPHPNSVILGLARALAPGISLPPEKVVEIIVDTIENAEQ